MIILLQYLHREIPKEERKIPGSIAGIVDATLTVVVLKYLIAV